MIVNRYIVIILALLIVACGGGKPASPELVTGHTLLNKSVDLYLRGVYDLADLMFYRTEQQFKRMDSPCNVSRVYIVRFMLDETGRSVEALKKADDYAFAGECDEEMEIVRFLSGEKYEIEKLTEPFDIIAEFSRSKDYVALADYANSESVSSRNRSMFFRSAAKAALAANDSIKAEKYARTAHSIDRFYGWTHNLLNNLMIIKSAYVMSGKDPSPVDKRIVILKEEMSKN